MLLMSSIETPCSASVPATRCSGLPAAPHSTSGAWTSCSRTRSWHYSACNLTAFFNLAMLGERVGVDVWTYQSADGRSLRKALDSFVLFAASVPGT